MEVSQVHKKAAGRRRHSKGDDIDQAEAFWV